MRYRISRAHLAELPRQTVGLPTSVRANLHVHQILTELGVKIERFSLFGLHPPTLKAPWKIWRDLATDDFVIEQGELTC